MTLTERRQDLFTMPQDYAFAHCISQDKRLGAGIAKQFVKVYPSMKKYLLGLHTEIGDAVLYTQTRPVFNLITKRLAIGKPTYDSLRAALLSLKEQMVSQGMKRLAMPQIGCGLDRLQWGRVRPMIEEIFADTDMEIVVCIL